MRRILESTLVSLDGVIDTPPRWANDYLDDAFRKDALDRLQACDAMLMGRVTYEMLSTAFANQKNEFADRMNGIRKYVFSSALTSSDWSNSEIVRGDVLSKVRELKARDGGDLALYGHGLLAQTLLNHGLIDELRITTFPVIVGSGKLFFRPDERAALSLIEAKSLATGAVVTRYQPN